MNKNTSQLPRRISLLMAIRRPLAFSSIQNIIKKRLPYCSGATKFSYGFECQFGNIKAHNVWLGDTIFNDHEMISIGGGTRFSGGNRVITGTHDLYDFSICHTKKFI